MYPDRFFVHRKTDGTVSCEYKRIARVQATPDNVSNEFNLPIISTLGFAFDKEEFKR